MTSTLQSSLFLAIGLLCVSAIGCCASKQTQPAEKKASAPNAYPYHLDAPTAVVTLSSPLLREISGIGPGETPETVVAIADELGEAYVLNTESGAILRKVFFRDRGDFEGVEAVGDVLYAIKSDGELYVIRDWTQGNTEARMVQTPLKKSDDIEGLAFDPKRNALLIACKNDPDSDAVRAIYAFDLKQDRMDTVPAYRIDPRAIDRMAPTEPDEKPNFFSPSGLAIHPLRKEIYVLSSAKKRLAVLDYDSGALLHVYRLDKNILPQPEGIAFDRSGNLLIASEGKKAEGLLLRFDYNKPAKNN